MREAQGSVILSNARIQRGDFKNSQMSQFSSNTDQGTKDPEPKRAMVAWY